jgi:hypothetical protein
MKILWALCLAANIAIVAVDVTYGFWGLALFSACMGGICYVQMREQT